MRLTIALTLYLILQLPLSAQDNGNFASWETMINVPLSPTAPTEQVVVAIVDDGFRLSHDQLSSFIWSNPRETNNRLDDDGNGYTDDISGWDISDRDNDVNPPEHRKREFYHGTYIASIITRMAKLHYGSAAHKYIKILPVKAIADEASQLYMKDGYKGIEYAIEQDVDIICLAWSGGPISPDQERILAKALDAGIMIIASAGNFNKEGIEYPSAFPGVFAVAGVDQTLEKQSLSSYGPLVNLSAPAQMILGAHPEADSAYVEESGTSPAAAIVAGGAAILMSKQPDLTTIQVKDAMLSSATPFQSLTRHSGKLGAGVVNVGNGLSYLNDPEKWHSKLRSKASITNSKSSTVTDWEVAPLGSYHGFQLQADISNIKNPAKHEISILLEDTLWSTASLDQVPQDWFVPAQSFTLNLSNEQFGKKDILKINYAGQPIDSTLLYCQGLKTISQPSGRIDDGSHVNDYANNCSCQWILQAPVGQRIRFEFDELDTQGNVDFVYLVEGKTAIPENFIAKFSGQNKPPIVESYTNEVLVWFLTDDNATGQGWSFKYEFIE